MPIPKSIALILTSGLLAGLTACATGTVSSGMPDLIPERRSGSNGAEGYCRRSGDNELEVVVRNQSGVDAVKPSKTQVKFNFHRRRFQKAHCGSCGRVFANNRVPDARELFQPGLPIHDPGRCGQRHRREPRRRAGQPRVQQQGGWGVYWVRIRYEFLIASHSPCLHPSTSSG